jgi:hypothetical protein
MKRLYISSLYYKLKNGIKLITLTIFNNNFNFKICNFYIHKKLDNEILILNIMNSCI